MQTTEQSRSSSSCGGIISKKSSYDLLRGPVQALTPQRPTSTTAEPVVQLARISSTLKKKPNVPLQKSQKLAKLQNTDTTNPCSRTTSAGGGVTISCNSNGSSGRSYNRNPYSKTTANPNKDNSTTTSESESDDTETSPKSNLNSSLKSLSPSNSGTKSAFFKTRKDKLKIRFELEPKTQAWDPGSGKYTKYPVFGPESSGSDRVISGGHFAPFTPSPGCAYHNALLASSTLLNSKKPKRTKSLKKILTKSRSFIGFGTRDTSSISRLDFLAKYKNKSGAINPPLPSAPDQNRWDPDTSSHSNVRPGVILCKNCGTPNLDSQAKAEKPVPVKDTNGKSWLGSAASDDTYFHGRYAKLPSDHGEFLSLNYYRTHHKIQGNSIYSPLKNSSINSNPVVKNGRAETSAEMAQQSSLPMETTTTTRADYKDQYSSFFDCRIPRPKLKFLVPTHSYGATSMKTGRKVDFDVSGFSEISLSDENDNEDAAYGSGSGSSSRIRSVNSSDDAISEFEKEQENSSIHEDRDYPSQVERIYSTEQNSPSSLGQFPSDYTALYSCEKGIVVKGNARRLLSFKKAYFPSLRSTKSSPKEKLGDDASEFLKNLPIFRKLSTGFLTKLSDHISQASYECGETIIRQGSRGEAFVILMSGTAKVTFLSNQTGEEIYLRTIHPGDSFGEKALQGDKVNMLNLISNDETVSCILISEEGFEQLMAKSVDFRLRFADKILPKINDKDVEGIELEDLRLISTLGIGGFGRVELVTLASDTSRSFALKQMKKCQIVGTRQVEHIKSEKAILMETNCDFITKLYKTYKDAKYLYMLMECCLGGELWTILRDRGNFDDPTARFYVGCVLEALKYLHSRNIIYRDLKPENLLLDPRGYLKLVDFGFAKKLEGNKTWTFCGTPEYVAPEIILNKGHDITADYWSLGVLMFELLTGTPPFVGGDPMRTYKQILKGIDSIDFPPTVGKNAYNLIRKLCQENPLDRLGAQRGGLSDIKKHKWLDGLDWNGLRSRTLAPPIMPYVRGPHDCGNFDEYPPDRSGTPPDDLSGWDWDF